MELDRFNIHQLSKLCEFLLDGEPVFIIRAQDMAATAAVENYIDRSREMGGRNLSRSQTHLKKIEQWRKENPKRLKPAD